LVFNSSCCMIFIWNDVCCIFKEWHQVISDVSGIEEFMCIGGGTSKGRQRYMSSSRSSSYACILKEFKNVQPRSSGTAINDLNNMGKNESEQWLNESPWISTTVQESVGLLAMAIRQWQCGPLLWDKERRGILSWSTDEETSFLSMFPRDCNRALLIPLKNIAFIPLNNNKQKAHLQYDRVNAISIPQLLKRLPWASEATMSLATWSKSHECQLRITRKMSKSKTVEDVSFSDNLLTKSIVGRIRLLSSENEINKSLQSNHNHPLIVNVQQANTTVRPTDRFNVLECWRGTTPRTHLIGRNFNHLRQLLRI
jgi:hypothetical protein